MKALLVIDMPKNCWECPCGELWECHLEPTRDIGEEATPFDKRMDWCPLKPIPQTRDVGYPTDDYEVGFGDGWDACLKEITGEPNESNINY